MSGIIRCPDCGFTWTSMVWQHCRGGRLLDGSICCQTFTSTGAGNRHRKGDGKTKRWCVPPASVGLIERQPGVWSMPASKSQKNRFPVVHADPGLSSGGGA